MHVRYSAICSGRLAVHHFRHDNLLRINKTCLQEKTIVAPRICTTAGMPSFKIWQFYPQGGSLDRVQTKIAADKLMIIFWMSTVISH